MIDKSEAKGYTMTAASGGSHGKGKIDSKNRENWHRTWDDDELAAILWSKLKPFVPTDLSYFLRLPALIIRSNQYLQKDPHSWHPSGICPHVRFYKYERDHFMRPHFDGTMYREDTRDGSTFVQQTFLSVLVYLNDDYEGGSLRFWDDNTRWAEAVNDNAPPKFEVRPHCGDAIIMISENLHECTRITRGVKYVLRTDVLYERPKEVHPKLAKFADASATKPAKEGPTEWTKIAHSSCRNYQSE